MFQTFVEHTCIITGSSHDFVKIYDIYKHYCNFCDLHEFPMMVSCDELKTNLLKYPEITTTNIYLMGLRFTTECE